MYVQYVLPYFSMEQVMSVRRSVSLILKSVLYCTSPKTIIFRSFLGSVTGILLQSLGESAYNTQCPVLQ